MRKLPLKIPSERLWAFSLPERGTMFVVDHDEVHRISLKPIPSVETLDDNPYEFAKTIQHFGVSERAPVLQAGGFKVSYTFDPKAPTQSVLVESSGRSETVTFETFSGDWFVATLSAEGEFLVLAEPYLIEVHALREGVGPSLAA